MKKLIIVLHLAIAANITSLAQENKKCDFEIDKTDEFTSERLAQTKRFKIINQPVNKSTKINVFANFKYVNGKRMIGLSVTFPAGGALGIGKFILSPIETAVDNAYQIDYAINACYIQFLDNSNFKLVSDPIESQPNFFILTDDNIMKMKKEKIIKMRLELGSSGNLATTYDCEIKGKISDKIQEDLQCIENIKTNMPKKDSVKVKVTDQSKENNERNQTQGQTPVNSYRIKEMPKPTNDTTTITLYKQWKLVTQIDPNGLPEDSKSTLILQFINNGTYKMSSSPNNGTVVTTITGKIQLVDKILIMTNDGDTQNYSSVISKLTKTELHLKTKKTEAIYFAY